MKGKKLWLIVIGILWAATNLLILFNFNKDIWYKGALSVLVLIVVAYLIPISVIFHLVEKTRAILFYSFIS